MRLIWDFITHFSKFHNNLQPIYENLMTHGRYMISSLKNKIKISLTCTQEKVTICVGFKD